MNRLLALDRADIFYESGIWPEKFKRGLIGGPLTTNGWFSLFVFLWQNGMHPRNALWWSSLPGFATAHAEIEAGRILNRIRTNPESFRKVIYTAIVPGVRSTRQLNGTRDFIYPRRLIDVDNIITDF